MATNNWSDRWNVVRDDLGAGGQGKVRLVERKAVEAQREEAVHSVMESMHRLTMEPPNYRNMVDAIRKFVFMPPPQNLWVANP